MELESTEVTMPIHPSWD